MKLNSLKAIKEGGVQVMKFVWELGGGEVIETAAKIKSRTAELYVSSQIGCGGGCKFCECSKNWLERNLEAKEVLDQVEGMLTQIRNSKLEIRNIVVHFNGTGEPTDNEVNVTKAMRMILQKYPRIQFVLTTCGSNLGAAEQWYQMPVILALSIHAPTDRLRRKIIESNLPIGALIKSGKKFFKRSGRKVIIRYMPLEKFNDKPRHIKKLCKVLDPEIFKIEICKLNGVEGIDFPYHASPDLRSIAVQIRNNGFEVMMSGSIGEEIKAECGQLRSGS